MPASYSRDLRRADVAAATATIGNATASAAHCDPVSVNGSCCNTEGASDPVGKGEAFGCAELLAEPSGDQAVVADGDPLDGTVDAVGLA